MVARCRHSVSSVDCSTDVHLTAILGLLLLAGEKCEAYN
jgi:hypothetical protein